MTVFFYGSFQHPDNEVAFASIQRTIQYSPTQRANIFQESWSLKGKIVKQGATSQADVFTALGNLRKAYSVNGLSAGLLDNRGVRTPFYLDSTKSIGGVIVTNPISHGDLSGAETVTYLNYTFGLQMSSFISKNTDLLAYSESLSFSDNGGEGLQVRRIPINGEPIIQNRTTRSFYFATQQGSLTTRTPNPVPEDPLFPGNFAGEEGSKQVTWTSPKMERGVPLEYTVSWSYKFHSAFRFIGNVHARG
jgi:hypothetical protein